MTGFDEVHDGVLDHLRVHLERRDVRVLAELTEDGVSYVAYSALDGQERRRDTSGLHLRLKEECYVLANLGGCSIYRRESGNLVRTVGLHDSCNLGGIDLDMVGAAAVGGFVDRYLATAGRIEGLIEIVHTAHGCREHLIEFDDDLIRHTTDSRHDAYSGSRHNGTVFANIRSLDDCPVGFRQEAITQVLRHVAQVHVEIVRTLGVDLLTHGFIRLIRRTELDSVRTCQSTVTTVSHRRTGLQSHTEGDALCVQFLCALCEGKRNCLGHTGGGKTTHAQDVTMLYQFGSLFGCHKWKCHKIYDFTIYDLRLMYEFPLCGLFTIDHAANNRTIYSIVNNSYLVNRPIVNSYSALPSEPRTLMILCL